MRRAGSIIVLLSVCILLAGCSQKDIPVRFYYPRAQVQFHRDDGVMVVEQRDSLSREDNLAYLMSFYLEGPLSTDLRLPVPTGTKLIKIMEDDAGLTLVMSREFARLQGMELTIACSCISATCFELTDASQVTITTTSPKGPSRTMYRDGITLTDTIIDEPEITTAAE